MVKKALGKHHKKPLLKTETAGKWSFIPLTYGMIGLDPYPYVCVSENGAYPNKTVL